MEYVCNQVSEREGKRGKRSTYVNRSAREGERSTCVTRSVREEGGERGKKSTM